MSTLLINIQDVRDFADLSVNITERKYNQYIVMAQERFLKNLIGSTCLTELEERKCAGTLTDDDKNLLVLIKPYLVTYSYSIYVSSSMKLSTNQGIVNITGDNATAIGQQQRVIEEKKYVLSAMGYGGTIKTFLIDNPDLYPCFDSDSCVLDTSINATYNPFFGL